MIAASVIVGAVITIMVSGVAVLFLSNEGIGKAPSTWQIVAIATAAGVVAGSAAGALLYGVLRGLKAVLS